MAHGAEWLEVFLKNKKVITTGMTATITNRKNWIDWAKALGILIVVMGHSNYAQEDISPMIFMIHMPLFFVVRIRRIQPNRQLSLPSWVEKLNEAHRTSDVDSNKK